MDLSIAYLKDNKGDLRNKLNLINQSNYDAFPCVRYLVSFKPLNQ